MYLTNFLDDVDDDRPNGCWSLQKDSTGEVAIIRNYAWAGFTAYHRANSTEHGCFYYGEGLKNNDLTFQL